MRPSVKIRILGCYGSETLKYKTTCFLINDRVSIDAGALTSSLSIDEQARIDAILITHCHFDHIKDVPFLIDNIFGLRTSPVTIVGLESVIDTLKKHVFNNIVWPDFSKLPTANKPVMKYRVVKSVNGFQCNGLKFNVFPVSHAIDTVGVKVSGDGSSFIISSDTGPTEMLWEIANQSRNLRALFV